MVNFFLEFPSKKYLFEISFFFQKFENKSSSHGLYCLLVEDFFKKFCKKNKNIKQISTIRLNKING
jgi:hypothetical protein